LGSEATEDVIKPGFCEMKFRWGICWQVQQDNATPLWKYEGVGRDGLTWLYEMLPRQKQQDSLASSSMRSGAWEMDGTNTTKWRTGSLDTLDAVEYGQPERLYQAIFLRYFT
jgi:hypothetical protein